MTGDTARRRARSSVPADPPPGWRYVPELLSFDEEQRLLAEMERLEFQEVRMHGVAARRTTAHFGWTYAYESRAVEPATSIPEYLLELRVQAAALVPIEATRLEEVLVTRYPEGATIGWHRDAPMFGPIVVGVSLLAACDMRFRRRRGDSFERFTQRLEPRSAYVLSGSARSVWQHSVPLVPTLRYSITFRTLR